MPRKSEASRLPLRVDPTSYAHLADSFAQLHFVAPSALALRITEKERPPVIPSKVEESTRSGSSEDAQSGDGLFEL